MLIQIKYLSNGNDSCGIGVILCSCRSLFVNLTELLPFLFYLCILSQLAVVISRIICTLVFQVENLLLKTSLIYLNFLVPCKCLIPISIFIVSHFPAATKIIILICIILYKCHIFQTSWVCVSFTLAVLSCTKETFCYISKPKSF